MLTALLRALPRSAALYSSMAKPTLGMLTIFRT